ncbi:MAG: GNAT family N-acetyltransferase [Deltaproteobacteria bacterium]|nr:GNAT family N-acetyltransferase [Deltaproteobacteria bacterium]
MRIRSPLPPERDDIARMISRGPFRPEEISCALELLDAALGRADTYEALIVEDPLPVAYVCFGATPMTEATFDVYWIVVAPASQGRGIGRTLMNETERQLAARGACTIRIETSSLEGEGGAVRFYERAGFARVGLIPDFYRPGDDLVTLAKRLG